MSDEIDKNINDVLTTMSEKISDLTSGLVHSFDKFESDIDNHHRIRNKIMRESTKEALRMMIIRDEVSFNNIILNLSSLYAVMFSLILLTQRTWGLSCTIWTGLKNKKLWL